MVSFSTLSQMSVESYPSVGGVSTAHTAKKKPLTPQIQSRSIAMLTASTQRLTPKILTREVSHCAGFGFNIYVFFFA